MNRQQLRSLIIEIVEQQDVDAELTSLFKDLGNEVGSAIENEKKDINEITGLGIFSLILSAPSILDTIGEVLNFIYSKIYKLFNKNDKNNSLKFANWLIKSGNSLHSKYISIIEFALKPFIKTASEKERRQIAEICYLLILVALCFVFGFNAINDLTKVKDAFPAIERSYALIINGIGIGDINKIKFKIEFIKALKAVQQTQG